MSSASFSSVPLSSRLLRTIRDVAIDNARQLLHEAPLLLRHHHHARAALLARVAIEEVGRAVQAFDALGRNVTDEAVAMRV
ncbi:MAG: AbiV family abortive infection protein, partial [Pseudomonadota bacterium]